MFKILFVIFIISDYHREPAISTQTIGEFNSLESCRKQAAILEKSFPYVIPAAGYNHKMTVLTACFKDDSPSLK